jgi:hypothetical protein
MDLFGFRITRKIDGNAPPVSFAPEQKDDGAVLAAAGGIQGVYIDLDGSIRNEAELVSKYREMSMHPEIDIAIDDIVNEAICLEDLKKTVTLNLDELEQPPKIKEIIQGEFNNILNLLEFQHGGYELFRRWYVDGRLYYHLIIDNKLPQLGVQEIRYVDPRKIRKVRHVKQKQIQGMPIVETVDEYYVYNPRGFAKAVSSPATFFGDSGQLTGLRISKDAIAHCTSGLTSINGDVVTGYLQKAIKPLNQLKAMEDSLVIYRISRAPERRVFYIDVGNLPKLKAEQYLRDVMTKFKNKLVYDASSGEIRDDRKFMTMLEDFWLPRREGGKGTEITTLPGGQNLGDIDDIKYFQNNLYKSLNVPITRLDPTQAYTLGRATEITRDEVKFTKFVKRLRSRFSDLFNKILEKQLILKGIINQDEWKQIRPFFQYVFNDDSHTSELKDLEILRDRIEAVANMAGNGITGKYMSHQTVRKQILKQSEEDIERENELIMEEMTNPILFPPMEELAPAPEGPPQRKHPTPKKK